MLSRALGRSSRLHCARRALSSLSAARRRPPHRPANPSSSSFSALPTWSRDLRLRSFGTSPSPTSDDAQPEYAIPINCPGCGAPSQSKGAQLPGFYPPEPSKAQKFAESGWTPLNKKREKEDMIWRRTMERISLERELKHKEDPSLAAALEELDREVRHRPNLKPPGPLVCHRCHNLVHHHFADPLPFYPTYDTLASLLLSSPHRHNHIYQLIDAADFPLSINLGLMDHLRRYLPRKIFRHLSMSYVVTRVDCIMPKEELVTSSMTYLRTVLKDFIPGGKLDAPLMTVSAATGWGVGRLKQEVKERQGGVWLVGKVNVGKSRLLREIWPADGAAKLPQVIEAEEFGIALEAEGEEELGDEELEPTPKLDPAPLKWTPKGWAPVTAADSKAKGLTGVLRDMQIRIAASETPKPILTPPAVSDIPGTTATPIRIVYKTAGRGGKVKAELVDLPGFTRWIGCGNEGLMKYVKPEARKKIFMQRDARRSAEILTPGRTLLIGGIIAISNNNEECVVRAVAFTAPPVHTTSNEKVFKLLSRPHHLIEGELAKHLFNRYTMPDDEYLKLYPPKAPVKPCEGKARDALLQRQEAERRRRMEREGIKIELPKPEFPKWMEKAGTFKIDQDSTTAVHPRLDSHAPEDVASLPFKILTKDIVLDGVGWVELQCQVRNRRAGSKADEGYELGYVIPEIDVWSPEGKGVAERRCMHAGVVNLAHQNATNVKIKKLRKGQKKRLAEANRELQLQGLKTMTRQDYQEKYKDY